MKQHTMQQADINKLLRLLGDYVDFLTGENKEATVILLVNPLIEYIEHDLKDPLRYDR